VRLPERGRNRTVVRPIDLASGEGDLPGVSRQMIGPDREQDGELGPFYDRDQDGRRARRRECRELGSEDGVLEAFAGCPRASRPGVENGVGRGRVKAFPRAGEELRCCNEEALLG
jgi:hypothetical protein